VIRLEVVICNALGLHARAAARFVQVASGFKSRIKVSHGGRTADGKSILGLLALVAAQGTRLTVSADGTDEQEALRSLVDLVRRASARRGDEVDGGHDGGTTMRGLGVSPGIAIGRALVLEGPNVAIFRLDLSPDEAEREVPRIPAGGAACLPAAPSPCATGSAASRRAVRACLRGADPDSERPGAARGDHQPHPPRTCQRRMGLPHRRRRYTQVFAQLGDQALRDRGTDIEDVAARVQALLSGSKSGTTLPS